MREEWRGELAGELKEVDRRKSKGRKGKARNEVKVAVAVVLLRG